MDITTLYLIATFIFGLILGSFLNVVVYRYNTGMSIKRGRSKCFSCGRELSAVDLIPVFSFIFFRGRCRTCKSKISWQYPLVEILTACLLTGIVYVNMMVVSNWQIALDIIIAALLICIGVYDLRHKIIPDGLVYTAAAIALVKTVVLLLLHPGVDTSVVLSLLAGPIVALPFGLLWLVSGGRWMGLGDAKLALVIGWMLGLSEGFTAIVYSFWVGTVVILACLVFGEAIEAFSSKKNALGIQLFRGRTGAALKKMFPNFGLRSEIPFGPFMIIGLYIVYFTGRCMFCLV